MSLVSRLLLGLSLCPLLLACDPDADKDGTGAKGGGNGACGAETITVVTDLATVPSTFDRSVGDMLAGYEGDYEGTFGWFENEGPVSVSTPGATTDWEFGMARAGGEVRIVEVAKHGEFPGGQLGGQPCSNRIEFDMRMKIRSADGALDEELSVTVTELAINYGLPNLSPELDLDALNGDLGPEDIQMENGSIDAVYLYADFAAPQVSGSLLVEASSKDFGGVLAGSVAYFIAYKDGANSRCGACAADEFCYLAYDATDEYESAPTATCQPIPQACTDTPTCECLTESLCPMQPGSCTTQGDVMTQACYE